MTICFILLIFFFIAEIFLRVIHIPGIKFNTAKFDNLTGAIYYPNSIATYRSLNGEYIQRTVNRWGYLDVNYETTKKPDVFRIGFFGDSYTEARQVPLEKTFFRLIESDLKEFNVETLSFGISGYGTLQSYLTSRKYTDFFDLDMVIYVFSENDVANQIFEINRSPNIPYATLKDNKLFIDNSFREKNKYRTSLIYRIGDYLKAKSLLVSTLSERITLLMRYGIQPNPVENKADRTVTPEKTTPATISTYPVLADKPKPSVWPKELKEYALKLEETLISRWKNEISAKSKKFIILYIPYNDEWQKRSELQDSWKSWLQNFCHLAAIDFVDPTESFFIAHNNGKKIYDDHFATDGHRAFANAFTKWFKSNYSFRE
jgi:hypothetical protein